MKDSVVSRTRGFTVTSLLRAAITATPMPTIAEVHVERFRYEHSADDRPLLENVSLRIDSGEIVAIVGANGAGKSTLIRILAGLTRQNGIRLSIGGQETSHWSRSEFAAHVTVIPQREEISAGFSVREVVGFARFSRKENADARAASIARALSECGIQSLADREMTTLSGGQQRLVCIARAVAAETPLLVLDEPTTHLDEDNSARIADIIRRQAVEHTRAVVVVLHDRDLVRELATRTLELRKGTLSEATS